MRSDTTKWNVQSEPNESLHFFGTVGLVLLILALGTAGIFIVTF